MAMVSTPSATTWTPIRTASDSAAMSVKPRPTCTTRARANAHPGEVSHSPRAEVARAPDLVQNAMPMKPVARAVTRGRVTPRRVTCVMLARNAACVSWPLLSQGDMRSMVAARVKPSAPVAPATKPSSDSIGPRWNARTTTIGTHARSCPMAGTRIAATRTEWLVRLGVKEGTSALST